MLVNKTCNRNCLLLAMLLAAVTLEILAADPNLMVDGTLESVTNLPSAEFCCSNNGGAGGRLELFTFFMVFSRHFWNSNKA